MEKKKGPKVRKRHLWVSGTTEGATDLSSGSQVCVQKNRRNQLHLTDTVLDPRTRRE